MSAVGIMNMRRIAAGITGKAVDTTEKAAAIITTMKQVAAGIITMVTRMVAADIITIALGKVAAVKVADITMTKLVFFE